MKLAYAEVIRPILEKAVMKTDNDLDNFAMELLDKLFDYNT
jgi:hypothetical protein